jgi:hypothetical protein
MSNTVPTIAAQPTVTPMADEVCAKVVARVTQIKQSVLP